MLKDVSQRLTLLARAEFGGESRQTPNPPFWGRFPESAGHARTCPVHAVLGVLTLMTDVLVRFPVRRHPSLPQFDQAEASKRNRESISVLHRVWCGSKNEQKMVGRPCSRIRRL